MPTLALAITDHSHVIAENPAEAGIHELSRALLLGSRIRRRLDFEFQTHFLGFLLSKPALFSAPACRFGPLAH